MAPLPLAILVYSAQLLIVVAAATAGAALFRLTLPAARLSYWRGVGLLCLALPLLAPFRADPPAAAVVFGEAAVAFAGSPASSPSIATFGSVIVWIYAGGVAVRLFWLLLGARRLRQIRARSSPAIVSSSLDELRMTLAPHAGFRCTDDVAQPVAFGLRAPVVLLPPQFAALDAEAQRSVACHELLHVARGDWLWIVLEEHLRALFWFHPAAWWVLEQVQLSREQVIDRLVVARAVSTRAYMAALMVFADERPLASPSMAFLRRRHLKFRLQQLSKEPHMSSRRLTWTMAALVAVMGATAAAAARALPLDLPALVMQAGTGASFEIRLAERAPGSGLIEAAGPGDGRIYLHPTALATAADVTSASVIDGGNSQFSVAVRFSDAASARMTSATQAHVGRPIAILLDRQVIAALTLRAAVGDRAVITGVTEDHARRIAAGLTPDAAAPVPPVNRQAAGVTLPVVVHKVNPAYTRAAMDAGIEGEVLLRVVVLADGTVGDVTVTQSLDTVYGLDHEAVDAMKQWEFRPGTKNGTPVSVAVDVEMAFTLK